MTLANEQNGSVVGPDERLKKVSTLTAILRRPELGAVAGLVLVTIFFFVTANPAMFTLAGVMNFMAPAAQLGILAIGAALLMIGGEFDLSIGSMVAFAGLVFGTALVVWQGPLSVAILVAIAFAVFIGITNAQLTMRTGLPSFIVTLAFLFILRGLTLVGLKWASGGATQLRGMKGAVAGSPLAPLFSGDAFPGLFTWLAEAGIIDTFPNGTPRVPRHFRRDPVVRCHSRSLPPGCLLRTRFGNWDFRIRRRSAGRAQVGVPVARVKTTLFVRHRPFAPRWSPSSRVLDAGSTGRPRAVFRKSSRQSSAAVIGGCLLTGGYGSAIARSSIDVFGMVLIGLTYTSIDQDCYLVFLGGMLLTAVVFNTSSAKRVTGER